MRFVQTRLYSFAAPLAFVTLPMLGFRFSQINDYLASTEFRQLAGGVITQFLTTIVDTMIMILVAFVFRFQPI